LGGGSDLSGKKGCVTDSTKNAHVSGEHICKMVFLKDVTNFHQGNQTIESLG
jgi:hypothetical protein